MYKKYTIPLSIFIVFENINTTLWTSENFNNNYIFYINSNWLYSINIFLKNDVFFSNSTLLENSAVDNKNNVLFFNNNYQILFNNKILIFYIYYFFFFKNKLIMFTTTNNNLNKLKSLDKLYKSSSWLERETSEMFKISFLNKTDSRRLLLDYSKQENPLLKDFPSEGFNDLFYSFFDDQVVYNYTSTVEL